MFGLLRLEIIIDYIKRSLTDWQGTFSQFIANRIFSTCDLTYKTKGWNHIIIFFYKLKYGSLIPVVSFDIVV